MLMSLDPSVAEDGDTSPRRGAGRKEPRARRHQCPIFFFSSWSIHMRA